MTHESSLLFTGTLASSDSDELLGASDQKHYDVEGVWLKGPNATPISLQLEGEDVVSTANPSTDTVLGFGKFVRHPGQVLAVVATGGGGQYSVTVSEVGRDVGPQHHA